MQAEPRKAGAGVSEGRPFVTAACFRYLPLMLAWLDGISYGVLVPIALLLGLAPFQPKPHLVEKIQMLAQGTLSKPIDIFDLLLHGIPVLILLVKIIRDLAVR